MGLSLRKKIAGKSFACGFPGAAAVHQSTALKVHHCSHVRLMQLEADKRHSVEVTLRCQRAVDDDSAFAGKHRGFQAAECHARYSHSARWLFRLQCGTLVTERDWRAGAVAAGAGAEARSSPHV